MVCYLFLMILQRFISIQNVCSSFFSSMVLLKWHICRWSGSRCVLMGQRIEQCITNANIIIVNWNKWQNENRKGEKKKRSDGIRQSNGIQLSDWRVRTTMFTCVIFVVSFGKERFIDRITTAHKLWLFYWQFDQLYLLLYWISCTCRTQSFPCVLFIDAFSVLFSCAALFSLYSR